MPSSEEYLIEGDRGRVSVTTLNTTFFLTDSNTSEAGYMSMETTTIGLLLPSSNPL